MSKTNRSINTHPGALAVISVVLVTLMVTTTVQASDLQYCRQYALKALFAEQVQRAYRCPNEQRYKMIDSAQPNNIWHVDRARHQAWCLSAGRKQADRLASLHHQARVDCFKWLDDNPQPLSCDTYAHHRSQNQASNKALDCGFQGPIWDESSDNRNACVTTDWPTLMLQQWTQRKMLFKCVGASHEAPGIKK